MTFTVLDSSGAMISPPVWADLAKQPVPLDRPVTQHDLDRYGIALERGRLLVFWDDDADYDDTYDDLIGIGEVEWDSERNRWVADLVAWFHYTELESEQQALWRRFRPMNGQPTRP